MRCCTGSQRRTSRRSVVMLSYFPLLTTSLAAALSTFCRGRMWTIGTVLVPWAGHFQCWNIRRFFLSYTEAILSNGTRKLLWFETAKMLAAVKNKFSVFIYIFIIIFRTLRWAEEYRMNQSSCRLRWWPKAAMCFPEGSAIDGVGTATFSGRLN